MIFRTLKVRRGHDCHGPEVTGNVLLKNMFLKNFTKFTGKHMCQSIFFNKLPAKGNFIKRETPTRVFQNTSGPLLLIIASVMHFLNKKVKCNCRF